MKRYLVIAAIYLILSLVLCFTPLFNLLGYEFAEVIAALTVLVTGPAAAFRKPGRKEKEQPLEIVSSIFFTGLLLLLLPAAIIMLNRIRVPLCNPGDGYRFYLLLPVASLLVASTIAGATVLIFRRPLHRLLGYYLAAFLSLGYSIWYVYSQPPIAVFNPLWGYFPGPIYDEALKATDALWYSRALCLLIAGALILMLRLIYEKRSNRIRLGLEIAALFLIGLWYNSEAVELGINLDREQVQAALGGKSTTEQLVVYYDKRINEKELRLFLEDAGFQYKELEKYFGGPPKRKLAIYLYASTGQKKMLVGAGRTNYADVPFGELHIHKRSFPFPALKHELAHLFSYDIGPAPFGAPLFSPWLIEGLATAADYSFPELSGERPTPDQIAAESMLADKLPLPSQMSGLIGFYRNANSRAYASAGSFCRYLIGEYGIEKFASYYGGEEFQLVYERPLIEEEKKWTNRLAEVETEKRTKASAEERVNRRPIFDKPCARSNADALNEAVFASSRGDYQTACDLAAKAAENDPDCANCFYRKTQFIYQAGDCELTPAAATEVVKHPYATRNMVIRAEIMSADCKWKTDRSSEAIADYHRLLRRANADSLIRELAAKIEVAEGRSPAVIKEYLLGESKGRTAMIALASEGAAAGPDDGLAQYLYGRQLYYAEEYQLAEARFSLALSAALPNRQIQTEALRLSFLSAFLASQYEAARSRLAQYEADSGESGQSFYLGLAEWERRIEFAISRRK